VSKNVDKGLTQTNIKQRCAKQYVQLCIPLATSNYIRINSIDF